MSDQTPTTDAPPSAAPPREASSAAPAVSPPAPAPSDPPTLIAYRIHKYPSMPIVPAPQIRQWMERTHDRFAYRCLPLLIANQNGWFIVNTHRIRCVWNGGDNTKDLVVLDKGGPKGTPCPAESHFGHGVLTFNLNYLFRTPPGWNLWARGPSNWPRDGVAALEGIIETDWSVATFTMNWKLTTPHQPVEFEPGEPICMISPVRRGETESFHPQVRDINSEPALAAGFEAWSKSRNKFNNELRYKESEAAAAKWQKEYLQGYGPAGLKAPQHQVKLTLREFDLPKPPAPAAPDASS
ncbi:MAG: DUF6065 family protein [Tepidisphaeraceae bacterium]